MAYHVPCHVPEGRFLKTLWRKDSPGTAQIACDIWLHSFRLHRRCQPAVLESFQVNSAKQYGSQIQKSIEISIVSVRSGYIKKTCRSMPYSLNKNQPTVLVASSSPGQFFGKAPANWWKFAKHFLAQINIKPIKLCCNQVSFNKVAVERNIATQCLPTKYWEETLQPSVFQQSIGKKHYKHSNDIKWPTLKKYSTETPKNQQPWTELPQKDKNPFPLLRSKAALISFEVAHPLLKQSGLQI